MHGTAILLGALKYRKGAAYFAQSTSNLARLVVKLLLKRKPKNQYIMYGYSETQPTQFAEFIEMVSKPEPETVGEHVIVLLGKARRHFVVIKRFIELEKHEYAKSSVNEIPDVIKRFILRTPELAKEYHELCNKVVILGANKTAAQKKRSKEKTVKQTQDTELVVSNA